MDVQNNTSHLHKLLQQKGHTLSRDIDVALEALVMFLHLKGCFLNV